MKWTTLLKSSQSDGTNSDFTEEIRMMRQIISLFAAMGIRRKKKPVVAVFSTILFLAFSVGSVLYVADPENGLSQKFQPIISTTFVLVTYVKYLFVFGYITKLWSLFDLVEATWKEPENRRFLAIFQKADRNGKLFLLGYGGSMFLMNVLIVVPPLGLYIVNTYLMGSENEHIIFIVNMKFGLNEMSYGGLHHFALVASVVAYNSTILVTMECFFIAISLHVAAMFALLQQRLAEIDIHYSTIGSDQEDCTSLNIADITKDLADCVNLHKNAIQCTDLLDQLYSTPLFVQFSISSAKICLAIWALSKFQTNEEDIANMTIIWAIMVGMLASEAFSVFVHCLSGQILINESLAVADSLYEINWYNTKDTSLKKMFSIILQRTQKPAQLTAGKFYNVSAETFSKIASAAGSYFAFLQSLDE